MNLLRFSIFPVPALAMALFLGATASAVGGEVSEMEPNDTVNQTKTLFPGQFGKGVITYSPSGMNFLAEGDFWRESVPTGGDLVFAFVDGSESSFGDTTLELNNFNFSTLEGDQDDGPGPGAAIGGAVSSQSGILDVLVSGGVSNVATTINPYRLYQALIKPTESAPEQEENNSFTAANNITARMTTGNVSGADIDFYKVFVQSGLRLVVIMDDNPDKDPTNTDTELSILNTDGTTILATGDNVGVGPAGAGDDNAAGAIVATTSGVYFIRVAHGGEAGAMDANYRFVALVDGAIPADRDTDGVTDNADNCPDTANLGQQDTDGDGVGNACDGCPNDPTKNVPDACGCGTPDTDTDGDGKGDACDNCPAIFNADQTDANSDGIGDACESPAPPPNAACGTCAPGAFPVVGLILPACLIGRRLRRQRAWSRLLSRMNELI
jgi:thrombospondin type 3 repeat protein